MVTSLPGSGENPGAVGFSRNPAEVLIQSVEHTVPVGGGLFRYN